MKSYKISCYMGLQYATIYVDADNLEAAIHQALMIPGVVEAKPARY